MFERFLPKDVNFFDFFDKHAAILVKVSQEFLSLVSHEKIDLSERKSPIKSLEHQADEIVHNCLEALHKTFITPIDRDHIYRLISSLDDIIDALNTAYNGLIIFHLSSPTTELRRFAEIILQSSQEVEKSVKSLRHLKNSENVTPIFVEIHRLENEADDLLHRSLASLFDKESDTRLIIKWKEVYEALEEATDRCEDVADAVQSIILENI